MAVSCYFNKKKEHHFSQFSCEIAWGDFLSNIDHLISAILFL